MTNLRRRVLVVLVSAVIVLSLLVLSSSRLDESHPLSLPGLKTKLLPPAAYLLPIPPTHPPPPPEPWDEASIPEPESPPLHNSTHWLIPDRKNATDLYGMTHERLLASFPTGPDEDGAAHPYEALNRRSHRRVKACLARRSADVFGDDEDEDQAEGEQGEVDCPDNVFKVALLFTNFYAFWPGTRGEDIQCNSVIDSLTTLDYTFFILPGWKHDDSLLRYHDVFRNMTSIILIEDSILEACLSSDQCIQSPTFPAGPPLSIFLTSSWWGYQPDKVEGHPLGNAWVMTPERIPGHGYLGYSIERECTKVPLVPTDERDDVAVILAKEMSYFYGGNGSPGHSAYPLPLYPLLPSLTSLTPILLAPASPNHLTPHGLAPLGHLPQANYTQTLARAKALIGIGFPGSSPSPYYALCAGVPFINPIRSSFNGTKEDWWKENKIFWWQGIQHGPLALIGEPYVYTIPTATNSTPAALEANPLIGALRKARENPIGRFVPEEMKEARMADRVRGIMERDWRAEGAKALVEGGGGKEQGEVVKTWLERVGKQREEERIAGG